MQLTGNGRYRFETVPGWGALPENANLGPTHGGIAVDGQGRVYVSTDAEHGIVRFSADGHFQKSFGPTTQTIHCLNLAQEGDTEVLWGAALGTEKVHKLSLEGEILLTIPNASTGEIPGGLKGVTAVVSAPDGSVFIACGYGSNRIHKLDATGKLLKTVGGQGQENGLFRTCHGLALDTRFESPRLLVCDRENRRLVHLDLELGFVEVHAVHLRRPCAVSLRGDLCAVAELEGRVTLLGKHGYPLAFLGDQPDEHLWAQHPVPESQLYDGLFTSPHGLSWDREGNLIVQDWNAIGRVTMLKRLQN
ncbi:MAG: 6-bladed beta-propeller [Planctomycetota bacterium]